jgi:hypothetical protein
LKKGALVYTYLITLNFFLHNTAFVEKTESQSIQLYLVLKVSAVIFPEDVVHMHRKERRLSGEVRSESKDVLSIIAMFSRNRFWDMPLLAKFSSISKE